MSLNGEYFFSTEFVKICSLVDSSPQKMVPSADSGSHLPFGLPPIFPELSEQLESYLTKPERIPIHNSEKAVRSVP
jgi:hypothetical protein